MADRATEGSTRDAIRACIREYPGIHLRAIERELGVSSALVHYHVKKLEKDALIVSAPVGGYLRFYPKDAVGSRGMTDTDREVLAYLREEIALHVVLLLLEHGPLSQTALGERLDLAKSTVSYHVGKLEERALVTRSNARGGEVDVTLKDPRRVRRLLTQYAPTHDLAEKFSDLWGDFYG